jgi:hypothetical protein
LSKERTYVAALERIVMLGQNNLAWSGAVDIAVAALRKGGHYAATERDKVEGDEG